MWTAPKATVSVNFCCRFCMKYDKNLNKSFEWQEIKFGTALWRPFRFLLGRLGGLDHHVGNYWTMELLNNTFLTVLNSNHLNGNSDLYKLGLFRHFECVQKASNDTGHMTWRCIGITSYLFLTLQAFKRKNLPNMQSLKFFWFYILHFKRDYQRSHTCEGKNE